MEKQIVGALIKSKELLCSLLSGDERSVASSLDAFLEDNPIFVTEDNSFLESELTLAFLSAKNYYNIVHGFSLPTGYNNMVFVPNRNCSNPVIIFDFVKEIKKGDRGLSRDYSSLKGFSDEILLVGIDYDKETKKHRCEIEKIGLNTI